MTDPISTPTLERTEPPSAADRETSTKPGASPTVSMEGLWSQKDYQAIAKRLIPDLLPATSNAPIWLGQVVFRFNAIAKGLTMTDPDHAGDFTLFADTMTARMNLIAPNALGEARRRLTAPQVDPRAETTDARRARVIRTLDTMLARISSRSLDLNGVSAEVGTLLGVIQDLIADTPP